MQEISVAPGVLLLVLCGLSKNNVPAENCCIAIQNSGPAE